MTPAQVEAARTAILTMEKAEKDLVEFQRLAFSDAARRLANETGTVGTLLFTSGAGMQTISVPPRSTVLSELEELFKLRLVQAQDNCRAAGVTL